MDNYNIIIEENISYPVTYRSDKTYTYAKAIIKGVPIEGYGTDTQAAYWSLTQKIYQHFHFKL